MQHWSCRDLKWHMDWCSCQNCRLRSLSNLHQIDNQQAQVWLLKSKKMCLNSPLWNPGFELLLTDFLTALISFSCVPWYAGTGHCSQWQCVVNCALGIAGTRSNSQAWVFALFLQTWLPARTISVCCTFYLWYWNCFGVKENKMNGWRNGHV